MGQSQLGYHKLLILLLCGLCLSLLSAGDVESRRRTKEWSSESLEKFIKKAKRVADQMERSPQGLYLRLAIPIGYYKHNLVSESSIDFDYSYGFMAKAQVGINLWSNFGVHGTYGFSMMLNKKSELIVSNTSFEGESTMIGHSFGGGVMWKPFYKPFLTERLKRYKSIIGSYPQPSGLRSFLNALYVGGDGFIVKNGLEFSSPNQGIKKAGFTMGWGWGFSAVIGYEPSGGPGAFDIGLMFMYTQSPSAELVEVKGKTALPGSWNDYFIGIRLAMSVYLPERSMISGLF